MKIIFLTGHFYRAKKQGGFHKFAEACKNNGHETIFFTFPTPLYQFFHSRDVNYNLKKLLILLKNRNLYEEKYLKNIIYLSLSPPIRYIKNKSSGDKRLYLLVLPIWLFDKFLKKHMQEADIFIFESNSSIIAFKYLKKKFPAAKFVYRPSDPIIGVPGLEYLYAIEKEVIFESDLVLLVNPDAIVKYNQFGMNISETDRIKILTNGVDLEQYKQKHKNSIASIEEKIALYIGTWGVDWDLLFFTASKLLDFRIVIISPTLPTRIEYSKIKHYNNILFIPGIEPEKVPEFVLRASIIIVPYKENEYKNFSRGITAKYYQAMVARKPIIAYHDDPNLSRFGIITTYTYESFIEKVVEYNNKEIIYDEEFLDSLDWVKKTDCFIKYLLSL